MKLNFWQTIGLIVVGVAGVIIVIREMSGNKPAPTPTNPTPPSTMPTR